MRKIFVSFFGPHYLFFGLLDLFWHQKAHFWWGLKYNILWSELWFHRIMVFTNKLKNIGIFQHILKSTEPQLFKTALTFEFWFNSKYEFRIDILDILLYIKDNLWWKQSKNRRTSNLKIPFSNNNLLKILVICTNFQL